jgi:hypothetical protein
MLGSTRTEYFFSDTHLQHSTIPQEEISGSHLSYGSQMPQNVTDFLRLVVRRAILELSLANNNLRGTLPLELGLLS